MTTTTQTELIDSRGWTWRRNDSRPYEAWELATIPAPDGPVLCYGKDLHVWVHNYGERESDYFSGWRVGRGASPGRTRYPNLGAAIEAAGEVARDVAADHLERARAECDRRLRAARATGVLVREDAV